MSPDDHVIRAVRPEEWRQAKELRLLGLQDPAAPVAFLETYEQSLAQPDSFWQQRTSGRGGLTRQFVAEAPDGSWSGSLTVLIEEAGSLDFMNTVVRQRQGHVVGVFLRSERRGTGLIGDLLAGGLDWAWAQDPPLERVRLCVHENNLRAQAAYRRAGFRATGLVLPFATDPSAKEYEMDVTRPQPQPQPQPPARS
ncbi:GNAT family N-acetyltransferase [Streptomyces fuscigenes]|uniref:GNAT family N-acetyltransferase n=1 Tax=Streptomyces fuscigenes TaxID=1528880 RepID=UPI001F2C42FA|nr:GNAT family N-acetyltransferase [Streptomyces fuscigenes]MCF3965315.1 GNAT family N-acetyltransferase [Streptomyces fuscigenes]